MYTGLQAHREGHVSGKNASVVEIMEVDQGMDTGKPDRLIT